MDNETYRKARHKAINEALEATQPQISMVMFALSVAAKAYDAGYRKAKEGGEAMDAELKEDVKG